MKTVLPEVLQEISSHMEQRYKAWFLEQLPQLENTIRTVIQDYRVTEPFDAFREGLDRIEATPTYGTGIAAQETDMPIIPKF